MHRFVIPALHKVLRENGLSPQDFAQITGLSLGTIKRLKQGLPVSKVSAVTAMDVARLQPHQSNPLVLKELSAKDLKELHTRRAQRKAQLRRFR